MFKYTETLGNPRALHVSHETNLIMTAYVITGQLQSSNAVTITPSEALKAHEFCTAQHISRTSPAATVSVITSLNVALKGLQSTQDTDTVSPLVF
jgi:hypothetical protein